MSEPVYLYILLRNDLASMTAGRAASQASHASNQAVFEAREQYDVELDKLVRSWEDETGRGFGTCIVLGITEKEMRKTVTRAQSFGMHAGIVHDPEYGVKDGNSVHYIPLDTCGYIMGTKAEVSVFTEGFDLY